MGLATLANVPTTPELLMQFSFANQDSHRKINAAIFARMNGQTVPQYPLDPIPFDANGMLDWGLNHQAMHNQQNLILGIRGDDFSSFFNFANLGQFSDTILQHFNEHYLAEAKLGIT